MKILSVAILLFMTQLVYAQEKEDLIGRWDLTMEFKGETSPSWLEVSKSGYSTLVGRFVYAFGSARPIAEINFENGQFGFTIPPQWEEGSMDMIITGKLTETGISGHMVYTDGTTGKWTGVRAPALAYNDNPQWGSPIELINGKDLTGWHADGTNQWVVENGILKSPRSGSNLLTDLEFSDFKLQVEFRYPKGSNSGIYLRGRYEVQIVDSYGQDPSDVLFAGVYGFLTPNQMAAKEAGQWQTYDITLIGRRVTVVANGIPVIQDQIIPGITGGAINSNESEPGPILLQGDHGPVEFRKMTLTPVIN